ncbi:hypothetical protein [Trichormus azollae]
MKNNQLVIIGDREFHGTDLRKWLHTQGLKYIFRQKGHHLRGRQAK